MKGIKKDILESSKQLIKIHKVVTERMDLIDTEGKLNSGKFNLDDIVQSKSVSSSALIAIFEVMSTFPKIQSFISKNYNLSKVVTELFGSFGESNSIKKCVLTHGGISNKDIEDIKLKSTNVTTLDLSYNNIKRVVKEMLEHLHVLDLTKNNLTTTSLKAFSSLSVESPLTKLCLDNNKIGDAGLQEIVLAINSSKLPSITHISLNDNKISLLGNLLNALADSGILFKELCLDDNEITLNELNDKGFESFAKVFNSGQLDLCSNMISRDKAIDLLKVFECFIYIDIRNNPKDNEVTESDFKESIESSNINPNVQFVFGPIDYYGSVDSSYLSGDTSTDESSCYPA